jgi:hypothetical protein
MFAIIRTVLGFFLSIHPVLASLGLWQQASVLKRGCNLELAGGLPDGIEIWID